MTEGPFWLGLQSWGKDDVEDCRKIAQIPFQESRLEVRLASEARCAAEGGMLVHGG